MEHYSNTSMLNILFSSFQNGPKVSETPNRLKTLFLLWMWLYNMHVLENIYCFCKKSVKRGNLKWKVYSLPFRSKGTVAYVSAQTEVWESQSKHVDLHSNSTYIDHLYYSCTAFLLVFTGSRCASTACTVTVV